MGKVITTLPSRLCLLVTGHKARSRIFSRNIRCCLLTSSTVCPALLSLSLCFATFLLASVEYFYSEFWFGCLLSMGPVTCLLIPLKKCISFPSETAISVARASSSLHRGKGQKGITCPRSRLSSICEPLLIVKQLVLGRCTWPDVNKHFPVLFVSD